MVQRNTTACQTEQWRQELAGAVRDPAELLALLDLPLALLPQSRAAAGTFALRVPRAYVARMRKADINDPLLRQVLPVGAELDEAPDFSNDPVGDLTAAAGHGVLHKYHGRVLAITTGACAVHCRYCFRRHFPYAEHSAGAHGWESLLDYVRRDDSITEVILSGGDPLALPDRQLANLAQRLADIPHLTRLRIHSRLPVVIPSRVDGALLGWLTGTRLQPVVVLHVNHANEIDADVRAATGRLKDAGATLLNQSVLLRGVNDSVDVLAALSVALFTAGVLPYYLHLLDRVQGAAHFDVDEDTARELTGALQRQLPGYLVPRLAREIDGHPSKSIIY